MKLSLAIALAGFLLPAHAQDKAAKDALRRLQQQNRALAQDKARLADEKAAADRERERLEKESKASTARAAALGRDLKRAEEKNAARDAELEHLTKEKAGLAARIAELEKRRDALEARVKAAEEERDAATARLGENRQVIARQAQALEKQEASHRQLEAVASELLERYRGEAGRLAVPLTGLSQVEIDNQTAEYRERIDALRLDGARR